MAPPTPAIASLPPDTDFLSRACTLFAEGHYHDAIPLFLHLVKQKPDMPFYQEMAKSALEKAGISSKELRDRICANI